MGFNSGFKGLGNF